MDFLCLLDIAYNTWALTWFGDTHVLYGILLLTGFIGYLGFVDNKKSYILVWSWSNFLSDLFLMLLLLNSMYTISVLYRFWTLYGCYKWYKNVHEDDLGDVEVAFITKENDGTSA